MNFKIKFSEKFLSDKKIFEIKDLFWGNASVKFDGDSLYFIDGEEKHEIKNGSCIQIDDFKKYKIIDENIQFQYPHENCFEIFTNNVSVLDRFSMEEIQSYSDLDLNKIFRLFNLYDLCFAYDHSIGLKSQDDIQSLLLTCRKWLCLILSSEDNNFGIKNFCKNNNIDLFENEEYKIWKKIIEKNIGT